MLSSFLQSSLLRYPNQILMCEETVITYQQMLYKAKALSRNLTEKKYGVLCKSELNNAIAILACIIAHKTVVPLSINYGQEHVKSIIETTKLSYLIQDTGITKICDRQPEIEQLENVCLIMCTSGTTGKPKGAMITEKNILTNLKDIAQYFQICTTDHILIARPLYHCAVLTGEFLISLYKGARISFWSKPFVPNQLISYMAKNHISVLCGTPTMYNYLCLCNARKNNPARLRIAVLSGECVPTSLTEKMNAAFPKTKTYIVYGLTEASPRVSFLPPDEFGLFPSSVGFPLASLKVRIINEELELFGDSIMLGYYNDTEATAQAFDNGWLRTGDLAWQDQNGRIYLKGRKDDLIIRAGMNIYPQEIENRLKSSPGIIDVVAYGISSPFRTDKLCVDIISNLEQNDICKICAKNLPPYQYPDRIRKVTSIAKNASGKTIRNKRSFIS